MEQKKLHNISKVIGHNQNTQWKIRIVSENVKFPKDHILASYDVKSISTNFSWDEAIEFALKRMYAEREIERSISRLHMKNSL